MLSVARDWNTGKDLVNMGPILNIIGTQYVDQLVQNDPLVVFGLIHVDVNVAGCLGFPSRAHHVVDQIRITKPGFMSYPLQRGDNLFLVDSTSFVLECHSAHFGFSLSTLRTTKGFADPNPS
ncbi:hypothetical protein D3C86_1808050 [compost metagenome]